MRRTAVAVNDEAATMPARRGNGIGQGNVMRAVVSRQQRLPF
ncbi:MAG TPA: hypothetical protein VEV40_04060 [Alloacidobacterium sp.]|nr:hypothetical protein [Alloacidobacterium sp.]HYK35112.1 hypothetical protein [Alloacidobacterium sp.]